MPPHINLSELHSLHKQKKEVQTRSFDRVLELCHRRIRLVASHGGQNTFFEVPGIILGYPLYNLQLCTAYVVDALRADGFLVQLLPPPNVAVLYLSWDPKEIRGPNRNKAPALMDESTKPRGTAATTVASLTEPVSRLRLF